MTACVSTSKPELLVDVPDKPLVIQVGITPALSQYEDVLHACASDVFILSEVLPWERLQEKDKDVFLVYGEGEKKLPGYIYQIGASPLVVVVHPDLPVNALSFEQIQAIYNGTLADWNLENPLSSYVGEIQIWGTMVETELMQSVLAAINLPNPTGLWKVAPTTADIVGRIMLDQNAIGIVPAFAVTEDVVVLQVDGVVFDPIPILAVWQYEPSILEQEWLLCVQEAMK